MRQLLNLLLALTLPFAAWMQSNMSGQNGSSSSSSPAPQMGYYLGNCGNGTLNLALCVNTPADTQQLVDCSWTSGSAVVNCATSHFVPADTGKRAFGYQSCAAYINLSANNNNNPITTGTALTITYVSATQVTLSGNAANTVGTNIGCFIFGHPDDIAAAALDAIFVTATNCPKLFLAATNYLFTTPHWFTNPTACNNNAMTIGHLTAGNMFWSGGMEIEGRGTGNTIIYVTPGFPETGACTNGLTALACFVVTVEGKWRDFTITGGGNFGNAPGELIEVHGPASVDNFMCINWGGNSAATSLSAVGMWLEYWVQLNQVENSGCGKYGVEVQQGSAVTAIRLAVDNPTSRGVDVGQGANLTFANNPPTSYFDIYNFVCYECRLSGGQIAAVALLVNTNGSSIKLYHSHLAPNQNNNNALIGYDCISGACLFDAEDTYLNMGSTTLPGDGSSGTGTGNLAILCNVACTNRLHNVQLGAATATAGSLYADGAAGSRLYNFGGITFGAGTVTTQVTLTGKAVNQPTEAGTVSCATSAATITFAGTYLFSPVVTIQDQTTAGAVTQTSLSATQKVVGCPGASDVLNYTVTPNPF